MPARLFADVGAPPLRGRERRPVNSIVMATRQDGTVVDLTIVDLSIDGCGAVCDGLTPGEPLQIVVPHRGSIEALVRWVNGNRAGLSFTSQALEDSQSPRIHERVSVEGEVALRRAGKMHFRVHVYDLSPEGCRAEFVDRPDFNEQLWIKFDGMEALEANVRWIAGSSAGLRFARPLHAAVFDLLVARLRGNPV